MIFTRFFVAINLLLFFAPVFAQSDSSQKQEIDEIVIVGEDQEERTEMLTETELLLNVAGAGLDPLAAIQALPGVTFTSDYSSEPAVRGSSPADNNYYIDLVPVRYVFHLFGNSIFNHNLIHSFDLYPAAFSSQFSNATGAIIDVRLRDPKNQEPTYTLDASLIGSGAMVESGITENIAVYASYRRSLIDLFIREEDLSDEDEGVEVNQLPISDDYQIKSTWNINDRQGLTFLAAGASDEVAASFQQNANIVLRDPDLLGPAKVKQRFDSQGLIWEWQLNDTNQVSWILTRAMEHDDISYGTGQFFDLQTDRTRLHGRWTRTMGRHQVIAGSSLEASDYDLTVNAKIPACSGFDVDCPTLDAPLIQSRDQFTIQSTIAYLEDQWQLNDDLNLRAGLHYLGDDYLHDAQVEPRLRLQYKFNEHWESYLAYGLYSQIPKSEEISPATGNPDLEYIQSRHSVVGLKHYFGEQWSWQVDLYYKSMDKLPLSLSIVRDPDYLDRFSNDAHGEAYGVEFLLNKKLTNKLYGWIALSIAESNRTNERTGETSEFEFDKPVILNLVGNYKLTERWMVGIKWSLQSGGTYTPILFTRPNSSNPDVIEPVYGELNSERFPFYHRLDVRVEYTRPTGYGMLSFYIDVLNAYNAKNVDGYRFAPNGEDILHSTPDGFGESVPVTESRGLPIFPSVGFKIQF